MQRFLSLFVLPALLGGCATTSPIPAAQIEAPAAWNEPGEGGSQVSADWWKAFGSDELQALVAQALEGSPDLAIAGERVRQAEAQVRIAGASLFPALNASVDSRLGKTGGETGKSSTAGLSASYEVDLWGGNAATRRGAEAALRASGFDREAARLTLIAGVATAYFEVLSLRGRVEISEVDGIPPEYAAAARRYLGDDVAGQYLAGIDQPGTRMARIDLRPTWVGVHDFRSRLPSALGGIS